MKSHTTAIRVRYCECDPMGVAHHSVFAVWFEIGRTEMLRADGGRYRDLESAGRFLVVVRLDIRFRRPARYDDLLDLTTTLVCVGHVKITHEYVLRGPVGGPIGGPVGSAVAQDQPILAVGKSTLACVDREGRLCEIPIELRAPTNP